MNKTKPLDIIIDSGCTWHVHPYKHHLINRKPTNDTISGIDGKSNKCSCIGDLPITAIDSIGQKRKITIKNVRCLPSSELTAISVEQLWRENNVDSIFANRNCLLLPNGTKFAFTRSNGLFVWNVNYLKQTDDLRAYHDGPPAKALIAVNYAITHDLDACNKIALKQTSHNHLEIMSPNAAATVMTRRLHLGLQILTKLHLLTSDIPKNINSATSIDRADHMEANAKRVPHSGSGYQPSYHGRQLHMDIAGPFTPTLTGEKWLLVIVDDHSRFKATYAMKRKSDALHCFKNYVEGFNRVGARSYGAEKRRVCALRGDNAGEFTSAEFKEYLEKE
jgi:hypothetical protein